MPTVCELIGVEVPAHAEGVSPVPLVDGDADRARPCIFAEVNYHLGYEPQRCVRTTRWKYIRRYLRRDREMLAHTDASLSRDVVDRKSVV